jgi:hypothetical protein
MAPLDLLDPGPKPVQLHHARHNRLHRHFHAELFRKMSSHVMFKCPKKAVPRNQRRARYAWTFLGADLKTGREQTVMVFLGKMHVFLAGVLVANSFTIRQHRRTPPLRQLKLTRNSRLQADLSSGAQLAVRPTIRVLCLCE